MGLYQLLDAAREPPDTALHNGLALLGSHVAEMDARVSGADGAYLVDLARAARRLNVSLRIHCIPQQATEAHAIAGEGAKLEVHVTAREWPSSSGAAPFAACDRVVIGLEPDVPFPRLDGGLRTVRFEFLTSGHAPDDSTLEGFRAAAAALVTAVGRLAEKRTEVGIRGALPFCLFSDGGQGVLARECLWLEDYRSPEMVLAYRSDGTVSPWRGRLQHLYLEASGPQRALKSFFRARQRVVSGRFAFRSCAECALRERRLCSAWDDLAPPHPDSPTFGVVPAAQLAADSTVWLRPHPEAEVSQEPGGTWLLHIRGDRTLDSLRLNDGAVAVWRALDGGRRAGELSLELARESEAWVEPARQLLERMQRSGFVLAEAERGGP